MPELANQGNSNRLRLAHPQKAGQHHAVGAEPRGGEAPERTLESTPPPSDMITYCVSYAWSDESKAVVDPLCEAAEQRGIKILRPPGWAWERASVSS